MNRMRDAYGNNGTLVPIVCRACGNVERLSIVTIRSGRAVACASCENALDLDGISRGLPKVVTVDAPVRYRKAVSEFP